MNCLPVISISLYLLSFDPSIRAQEFPKGAVCYLELQQGLNTSFHGYNDLYIGALQLRPQWTIVPGALRLGADAGLAYSNAHIFGLLGPTLAWKLATLPAGPLGSLGNLQLQAECLWGTWHQRLVGGGCKLELGILMLGITAHRDYGQNSWWFQASTGYNLARKKRPSTPVDPLQ